MRPWVPSIMLNLMPVVWTIYALLDPRTGEVRYVGKTHQEPGKRLKEHLQNAKNGTEYSARWIATIVACGLKPEQIVLQVGVGPGWGKSEKKWITRYRLRGARLTNLTDGGEGCPGMIVSAETRAKLSWIAFKKNEAAVRRRVHDHMLVAKRIEQWNVMCERQESSFAALLASAPHVPASAVGMGYEYAMDMHKWLDERRRALELLDGYRAKPWAPGQASPWNMEMYVIMPPRPRR